MTRPLKLGLVLPTIEQPVTGTPVPWTELRAMASLAENLGFDAVWVPDEFMWRVPGWPGPRGWWECVSLLGAVAASTSRVEVGPWVMAGAVRSPALVARIAETIDEVAGGRLLLGLGVGSPGTEFTEFGFPTDHLYSRFEEAFSIVRGLLRDGRAEVTGTYHQVGIADWHPRGPRAGEIPLFLGAKGPKMLRLAARHADVWSWFVQERNTPEEFTPLLEALDRACDEVGRDPATIGRSVGLLVQPGGRNVPAPPGFGIPIGGSSSAIAEALAAFADVGITRIEVMFWPFDMAAVDAMGPVIEELDKG